MIKKIGLGLADAIIINLSIVLAFLIRYRGDIPEDRFGTYTSIAIYITILSLMSFYIFGLYDRKVIQNSELLFDVSKATVLSHILMLALDAIRFSSKLPKSVIIISLILSTILIFSLRKAVLVLTKSRNVLIIGAGKEGKLVSNKLKEMHYRIIGFIDDNKKGIINNLPILGKTKDIKRIVDEENVDEIISTVADNEKVIQIIKQVNKKIKLKIVSDLYNILISNAKIDELGIPVVEIDFNPTAEWYSGLKKAIDIACASISLILLAIPFLIISILIKTDSKGPVFYKQERIGKNGKEFQMIKFRTMKHQSEKKPTLAKKNDDRITRIGRILRVTHIDELPQIINILKGEMSFVGPRPERPFFSSKFENGIKEWKKRIEISPGLTGLAQVKGDYYTQPHKKLKYDLYYLKNQSISLDTIILLETFKKWLKGRL